MDEIIYLEPDEEITSVIDKIKNTQSAKLGLVVPRQATLLQSVVNLRLLSREATALGKEIAIVTTDRIGRNLAAQIGLPVFNSIEEQKPIFQPAPPTPSVDEVIELDMANKVQNENMSENPPGVQVHHFQQEKPIAWRPKEKPVLKPEARKIEQALPRERSVNEIIRKDKDHKKISKILWPIMAIILVLIGIAAYLLWPKAYVNVFIPSEDLKKEVQVAISDKINEPNLEQNVLPGEVLESSAEKQDKFVTTGKKNIGEKAKGTVTIYNNLDSSSHAFPAGTKLSNTSKTFLTKAAVSVPGATVQNLKIVPGSVSVEVEAENPGQDYNVKAGRFSILELPAASQEAIYGNSSESLAGGMSREVQVVSQEDYDKAKNKLIEELSAKTKQDISTKAKDQKMLEKALVSLDPEISSTANVDSEAKDFEMKVKVKQQAMVFNYSKLKEFLVKVLEKQVPSDKMVAIASDEDVNLAISKTAYDKGQLDLDANVLAKIAAKISPEKIKGAILGKNMTDAESYIRSQDGVQKVEIDFTPSWWLRKIPDLERNVIVRIEYVNITK